MSVEGTQFVYEIPGKLSVRWHPGAKAIVDSWTSYNVTLDEFRDAVLVKGLDYAKKNGVQAWIVDSHSATGSFSQEIQSFIGSDVFPAFAKNGVKFFMTITAESSVTKMTVAQYSAKTGPNGIKLLQGKSAEGAVEWLVKNS